MWNQVIGAGPESVDTRPTSFLIVETGEIFNTLRERCRQAGEESVVDFDDDTLVDFFMDGLCSNLSYQPLVYAKAGIETLLINSEPYLLHHFSEYQKQLWREAGLELWECFNHLGLYGSDNHHMYEYEALQGTAIILKKYVE